MKNTILKNKKFIVSIIVLLIAVFGFAGYKFYINSKAVDGIKEYKIIVTDSDKTFSEEFDVTTKEKSLGEDLDKRKLIESENGSYGRFVTEVNGRKADGSPYLESERKHCGKEWKRCADFCQIFERCRICTEEALYNADRWRRGRNHLPE